MNNSAKESGYVEKQRKLTRIQSSFMLC